MPTLFHITTASDWQAAQAAGDYRVSTLGRTLEDEGFIHCSYADQVVGTANRFYRGMSGLVLLVLDPARLSAPVREESVAPGGPRFPHIYGALNLDAVVEVLPFEPAPDGSFTLPDVKQR